MACPPVRCLRLPPSTLPAGEGAASWDFVMGYFQAKLVDEHCVNDLVRPTRICRASQGPQCRVVPLRGVQANKARPDRWLCTAVSSADPAESLGV